VATEDPHHLIETVRDALPRPDSLSFDHISLPCLWHYREFRFSDRAICQNCDANGLSPSISCSKLIQSLFVPSFHLLRSLIVSNQINIFVAAVHGNPWLPARTGRTRVCLSANWSSHGRIRLSHLPAQISSRRGEERGQTSP
jgi:hypothetical protein